MFLIGICFDSNCIMKVSFAHLKLPLQKSKKLNFICCALSSEIVDERILLQMLWERWDLDDTGRAEIPLTDDYKNAYSTGMAVDLTSTTEVSLGKIISGYLVYWCSRSASERSGCFAIYFLSYLRSAVKSLLSCMICVFTRQDLQNLL